MSWPEYHSTIYMATWEAAAVIKMTFTLDERTARDLERAAYRLGKPKSLVVREAIQRYGEELGRLSEEERAVKLRAFDELVPSIPKRDRDEINAELAEIRRARRHGGRASRARRRS